MHEVVTHMVGGHDLSILGVAVIVCLVASYTAVALFQRGRQVDGVARWVWLGSASLSGGFGIWATHFIAMIGYHGVVMSYGLSMIFLSFGIGVAATFAAVTTATMIEGRLASVLAGLFMGLGIAMMHFTGMFAIEFPVLAIWDDTFVWASITVGTVLSIAAFLSAAVRGSRFYGWVVSGALVAVSILAMHMTAMAGINLMPDVARSTSVSPISDNVMVVVLVAVALSLLSSVLSAAMFAVRSENKALVTERNLRLFVKATTDYAIYTMDVDGRISDWNAGAERAMGYSAEEVVGKPFWIFRSQAEQDDGSPQRILEIARTTGKYETQGWRHRKDGSSIWAHSNIDAIRNASGKLLGFVNITRDITQHKLDEQRIEQTSREIGQLSRNLDIALENMTQAICLFDKDERLVLANHHYGELFNFPPGSIRPGMLYRELIEVGYHANFSIQSGQREKAKLHYDNTLSLVKKGGGRVVHRYVDGTAIQQICTPLQEGGWVATYEDITERVRSSEQLSFMARHDPLTGLPNRTQFSDVLSELITAARRKSTGVAVVGIDLDKFKEINDRHGHAAGDVVLTTLAEALSKTARDGELVARIGGDEFAAVKRYSSMDEVSDFIRRVEEALFCTIPYEANLIRTSASLGVALFPEDGSSAEMLVANADMAMNRAKHSLVNRVCFYESAMDQAARERRSLANDLWTSAENGELHLCYQVQKSVGTGEITGYEVLLRWQHPTRGNIPPMDFIPLAEECGAILPIGEWVLREACREAARWTGGHKIAVNLSPVQLCHADMAAVVLKVLVETGMSPGRLEIEITESSIITDKERALHTMRQIKELGVQIAIDDFGTGYSSLETLRAFPFDKIKLDKSFMAEVATSPQSKAIVRAILTLGRSLGIAVLAEGVETQAQLDILVDERCDEAQGYLLGRPTSPDVLFNHHADGNAEGTKDNAVPIKSDGRAA
jgi:diguanylate cyclase (GGDEF)-like protein/PAS domain S-box-containing protein